MIDPVLERRLADLTELLELWRNYHEFFARAVKGENMDRQSESAFLELKSRIAMLHDTFMECLEHDQAVGQSMLNIITRSITMRHVNRLNAAEIKKTEIEWHEAYLLLNETLGVLQDRQEELKNVSKSHMYAGKFKKDAFGAVSGIFGSLAFKIVLVLFLVVGVPVGLQVFGIFDWNYFRKFSLFDPIFEQIDKRRGTLAYKTLDEALAARLVEKRPQGLRSKSKAKAPPAKAKKMMVPGQPQELPRRSYIDFVGQRKNPTNPLNLAPQLDAATDFRIEEFMMPPKGPPQPGLPPQQTGLNAYYFLFPDVAEATAIEEKYNGWLNSLNEQQREPEVALTSVFRKRNVIVFLYSQDRQARETVKTDVWDVQEE